MVYFFVGIGAALGGILRYWLSDFVFRILPETFPYGTLLVNVAGSFLLGLIMFYFDDRELIGTNLKVFLTVGFCGGFTTFSTFSLETINLFRETQFFLGLINILLNLALCLFGIFIAYLISKIIG